MNGDDALYVSLPVNPTDSENCVLPVNSMDALYVSLLVNRLEDVNCTLLVNRLDTVKVDHFVLVIHWRSNGFVTLVTFGLLVGVCSILLTGSYQPMKSLLVSFFARLVREAS